MGEEGKPKVSSREGHPCDNGWTRNRSGTLPVSSAREDCSGEKWWDLSLTLSLTSHHFTWHDTLASCLPAVQPTCCSSAVAPSPKTSTSDQSGRRWWRLDTWTSSLPFHETRSDTHRHTHINMSTVTGKKKKPQPFVLCNRQTLNVSELKSTLTYNRYKQCQRRFKILRFRLLTHPWNVLSIHGSEILFSTEHVCLHKTWSGAANWCATMI